MSTLQMRADRMISVEPTVSRSTSERRLFQWRRRPARIGSEPRAEFILRQAACPVCLSAEGTDSGWLRRFLQEGYQIREVLGQVARDVGFCGRHAERLARFEDYSTTIAHVHAVILRRAVEELGRRRPRQPARRGAACRACVYEAEASRTESFFFERMLVRVGVDHYGDPAMLCARHLGTALDWMDRWTLQAVLRAHAERLGPSGAGPPPSAAGAADERGRTDDAESSKASIARVMGEPHEPANGAAWDGADTHASIRDPLARLKARLADRSCAICGEMRHLQLHWLRRIDAESAAGERIEDILPACPHHVWSAFHRGGPALREQLAKHAVRQERARILHARRLVGDAPGSTRHPWLALVRALHRRAPGPVLEMLQRAPRCPLCNALTVAERRTIELLGVLLGESGTRQALERGFGVCARHTLGAVDLLGQPAAAALAGVMRVKFDAMIWELDEMLRRSAWNTRAEPPGEQDPSWRRAVLLVSGRMS